MSSFVTKPDFTVTIELGATFSGEFHVGDYSMGNVEFPADLTSIGMTFEGSNDKVNWQTVRTEAGAAMASVVCAANAIVPFPVKMSSYRYGRVKVGSAEAAARTVNVFMASPAGS